MKNTVVGMTFFAIISLAATANAGGLEDFAACRGETDSLKRLTCYDAVDVAKSTTKSPEPQSVGTSPITLSKQDLRVQLKDPMASIFSNRVTFTPSFKNASKKTVVALEHTLQISDAFGVKVVDGSAQLDIRIPPDQTVKSDTFYLWEDNQFIHDEPYDKLQGPVTTGVAKAVVVVKKAVFSDGTVETY